MTRICVFCGSSTGADPRFVEAARRLGAVLAARGLGLVYGGAGVGLMGALADTVRGQGGEVIGVLPRALARKELAHTGLSELRLVDSMHERKAVMAELSDGFLALPGGMGTLEELCEALTWLQLGIHSKPVGLLNVAGYFDRFLAFLDHAVAERLLKPQHRALALVEQEPGALLDRLTHWRPLRVEKWLDREQV